MFKGSMFAAAAAGLLALPLSAADEGKAKPAPPRVVPAAAPAQAVDPATIQDKVSIALGGETFLKFQRVGDRLSKPVKADAAAAGKASVKAKLKLTSASPVAPPREGATRPYLAIDNGFDKPLRFKALARRKGSKEFFALADGQQPLAAGEAFLKCWDFDDAVEEVVLYGFELAEPPAR